MKVMTYITYDCEDAQGITLEDFKNLSESEKDDLFDNIAEYVWHESESKSEAIWRHDEAFFEWQEDVNNGVDTSNKFY